jgi:peptidoglycan/xylan/chitin deacetylase (PgdA/CDA1 family)
MIGVAAKLSDHKVICEFFEFFKTEWEFERPGVGYDVIIRSSSDSAAESNSRLVIILGTDVDDSTEWGTCKTISHGDRILLFNRDRLPIYGKCLAFPSSPQTQLVDELTREPALILFKQSPDQTVLWIGYDLWDEIRYLLVNGQPESFAGIPAVELHVELLRRILHEYKVPFAEVTPVPAGHKFIACLTHDVDHASIRAHKFDRTVAGFVYRATVQSFFHFCSGRKSLLELLSNWAAVISLPLVQLGLLPDIWSRLESYADLEEGIPSTFFVIPKAGEPGRLRSGNTAPKLRAVRYTLAKVSDELCRLIHTGHEIALHGLNAWLSPEDATHECVVLQNAVDRSGSAPIRGVRMHWLYYDQSSSSVLDQAGFHYDSTVGYNRTIGYRSGTCQVYKPLETQRLKELPLHVMDTALLFPAYMNCRPDEARVKVKALISNAVRFGGVLTINWHDRSIAPERLWHRLYADIIAELKNSGAWFATASKAVAWFEKRRAFAFDSSSVALSGSSDDLPALTVKEYHPAQPAASTAERAELSLL